MKRAVLSLMGLFLFALTAAGAAVQAQTPEPRPLAEIKQLRRELLEQRLEFQQWKLKQIERELQTAQTEQQRLEAEGRAIQQELSELSATGEELGELEMLKAGLAGNQTEKLVARRQVINQRISELTQQASEEQTRLRQLTERLKNDSGQKAK
jgi:chromosome segregation ATPase